MDRTEAQNEVVRQFGHDHYYPGVRWVQIEDLLSDELDSGDCWTPTIAGAVEQLCIKCDIEHQFDADLVRLALGRIPRDSNYGDSK